MSLMFEAPVLTCFSVEPWIRGLVCLSSVVLGKTKQLLYILYDHNYVSTIVDCMDHGHVQRRSSMLLPFVLRRNEDFDALVGTRKFFHKPSMLVRKRFYRLIYSDIDISQYAKRRLISNIATTVPHPKQ